MDVAVYVFTGFLEAGKTTLMQETLSDASFNGGEKTLILLCEEGEEELDPRSFPHDNVFVEVIDSETRLTQDKFKALTRKHGARRVFIEYNGMWQLESLYNAMPDNWYIFQEIMLADANSFESYNTNMRSLVVDKLQNCELVVFNRFAGDEDARLRLHKIVRGVSRQVNIAYEHPDHEIEYDQIEDPLPYDLNADVVEIEDRDYAIFYRDMSEEMEKYASKTIRLRGIVARDPALSSESFVIGRHVMTCCADDITYRGLVCTQKEKCPYESKDWVILTAKLEIAKHKLYRGPGPIFRVISVERCDPLPREEQVAVFY